MVLPPYVHNGKMHETIAHFTAIFEATDLPCMLYNNPIAYGTDVTPEIISDLADRHANLKAVNTGLVPVLLTIFVLLAHYTRLRRRRSAR